jgi:predicted flap endonuclease-1-like 5' DNA nuclease
MLTVADFNLVPILIALLIGLVAAFWTFRRARIRPRRDDGVAAPAVPATPYRRPVDREGDGVPDEFAAATRDVAGEILGVEAHPDIPDAKGPPDDLQLLKGVGPKLAAQLRQFGITRFEQLAGLGDNEVALLDARLGAFSGRIARDRLVEQACYLQRGDTDGFEAKFGKLGG